MWKRMSTKQASSSPIAYYQQVGRAGRSLQSSRGVLLRGSEDKEIQDFFIETAFHPTDSLSAYVGWDFLADGLDGPSLK